MSKGKVLQRTAESYSVITVDWPEISNRLRQRMFLQAIMSSLRTIYDRNLAKRARSRSSARPPSWRFLVRTTHVTSYSAGWWQWGQLRVAGFFSVRSSKKSRSSMKASMVGGRRPVKAFCTVHEYELLHVRYRTRYGNMKVGI